MHHAQNLFFLCFQNFSKMANEIEQSESYFYVNRHDAVKSLKINDTLHQVSGYLCYFRDNSFVDFYGDYFTADTDFGLHSTSPVYYQHLADGLLKSIPMSETLGKMQRTEKGIWIDAQINLAKDYAAKVAERYGVSVDEYLDAINSLVKMANAGILGWSSGTAGHTYKAIQQADGSHFLKMWHLGLDASLTPNPAEYRTVASFNRAMPLKSLIEVLQSPAQTKAVEIAVDAKTVDGKPDETNIDATTKTGKIMSKQNFDELQAIAQNLSGYVSKMAMSTGYAMTDNAPTQTTQAAQTDSQVFNMQGQMMTSQMKNLPQLPKVKASSPIYDIVYILYDIAYLLDYTTLEALNLDFLVSELQRAVTLLQGVIDADIAEDSAIKTTKNAPQQLDSQVEKQDATEFDYLSFVNDLNSWK